MKMTDYTQSLMDRAYDRWQNANWSKEEFWAQLDMAERVAVFVGNLNYQVENGGFSQWGPTNGYGTAATASAIVDIMKQVNTPASLQVASLVDQAWGFMEGFDEKSYSEEEWDELSSALSPLDSAFYEVNDQMIKDVDAWIVRTFSQQLLAAHS